MPKPELSLNDVTDSEETDIGELHSSVSTLLSTTALGSAFDSRDIGIAPDPLLASYKSPRSAVATSSSPELGRIHDLFSPRSATLPRGSLQVRPRTASFDLSPALTAKIRRWILGIALVDFDLDDGPVISNIHPPLILFPGESENLAFSSFPDSLQFDQGSQTHSFRIREQTISVQNDKRPASCDGWIYGYSHFMQRRDPGSRRGYQQRSLVILTHHHYYPALFYSMASTLGPLFALHGTTMLECACHNIASWLDPKPGSALELGFLGSVIQVELPNSEDEQQLTPTSSFKNNYDPRTHILASSAPFVPPSLELFEASLTHLWSLWECTVLFEPILVFGRSPAQTSQAIWWLRDLLRPIPFGGDIRPYFTIQDKDHSSLVNKLQPKSGLLLGVTNPFFEKSCSHWPHILSLGRKIRANSVTATAAKGSGSVLPAGPAPGWKTKTHSRYISKDRTLLKQLEDACGGSERERTDASLLLRRHFSSRTTELLIPLTRYLNTLIPTPSEVQKSKSGSLRLKPFNTTHFFASLKKHGSTLPFKSNSKRTEFYERWLKTPAFGMWLAKQESIVQDVLKDNQV